MVENGAKQSWPDLIGKDVEEAKNIINKEHPGLNIIVLKDPSPTTKDYSFDRIRVFHKDNIVSKEPFIS
jgi:hypothetical protein